MTKNLNLCYSRNPQCIEDGIPIFSQTDFYVANYDKISSDHLKHFEATGHNPFMQEDHWRDIEESTGRFLQGWMDRYVAWVRQFAP